MIVNGDCKCLTNSTTAFIPHWSPTSTCLMMLGNIHDKLASVKSKTGLLTNQGLAVNKELNSF